MEDVENPSGSAPESSHFLKFVMKEIFDKIGFGFGSQQFINVLLLLSGASVFMVGIVNGLKAVLSILLSVLAQEYNRAKRIGKRVVGFSGIILGFSFLFMAMGKFISSQLIFSLALLLGSLSLVVYGDFSQNFFFMGRKKELLSKIAKYGLIVTAISLFLSAFIIDSYSENNFFLLYMLGKTFVIRLPGYFIAFEIAAVSFILAGYFLASTKDTAPSSENEFSFALFYSSLKEKASYILKNKFLLSLMVFNITVSIAQVVGHSYYGIFIYQNYKELYFGGFLNLAVVFLIGVFSSLIGYIIAKMNIRSYGPVSILLIGSLLLASMPIIYYIGTNLAWLTAGTILGVIGASALGIANSMFVMESLHEQDRKYYYTLTTLFSVIPYLVIVPALSYIAQVLGLELLFLVLGITIAFSALFTLLSYRYFRARTQNLS